MRRTMVTTVDLRRLSRRILELEDGEAGDGARDGEPEGITGYMGR